LAVKRPVRPYKNAIGNRFTKGTAPGGAGQWSLIAPPVRPEKVTKVGAAQPVAVAVAVYVSSSATSTRAMPPAEGVTRTETLCQMAASVPGVRSHCRFRKERHRISERIWYKVGDRWCKATRRPSPVGARGDEEGDRRALDEVAVAPAAAALGGVAEDLGAVVCPGRRPPLSRVERGRVTFCASEQWTKQAAARGAGNRRFGRLSALRALRARTKRHTDPIDCGETRRALKRPRRARTVNEEAVLVVGVRVLVEADREALAARQVSVRCKRLKYYQ
jgi:hypothetical protein